MHNLHKSLAAESWRVTQGHAALALVDAGMVALFAVTATGAAPGPVPPSVSTLSAATMAGSNRRPLDAPRVPGVRTACDNQSRLRQCFEGAAAACGGRVWGAHKYPTQPYPCV